MIELRSLSPVWRAGLAGMGLAWSACIAIDDYRCSDDAHCALRADGQCHDNRRCSYPDPDCPDTQRRWSANAGDLANQCVVAEVASDDASSDGPNDGDDSGGDDTTSDDRGDDEPSSDGSAGSDGGPAVCGNGELEGDEVCDDDNDVDGDGCNADCRPSGRDVWSTPIAIGRFENTLEAIALADNGDIVAAGYTATSAAEDRFDSNQYEFLATRLSSEGDEIATSSAANDGRDQLRCIFVDGQGQVWAAGQRNSSIGAELWLGRWDDEAFITEVAYGDIESRETVAQDCAVAPGGEIVVVGMLDGGQAAGYEAWDRFILYDAMGGGWSEHLPAPLDLRDIVYGVAIAPDGRVVVAGSTNRFVGEHSDRWVSIFEPDGTQGEPFEQSGPGGGQEEVFAVAVHGDAVFTAGAQVINDGNLEREWVGELALRGLVWRRDFSLELQSPSWATDLAVDSAGRLVVVGATDVDGEQRGFAAKLDPETGDTVWLRSDLGLARASALAIEADDSVVVAGSTVERGENGTALVVRLAP